MDPIQLLASLGITVEALQAAAGYEIALKALGQKAYDFGNFLYRLKQEPIKGLDIPLRQAYNIANYFAFQGRYLALLSPGTIPLREMAEFVPRRPSERVGELNYRYDVKIEIHGLRYGDRQVTYVSVDSKIILTEQEALARAWQQLLRDLNPDTLPGGQGDPFEILDPDFALVGFYALSGS